VVTHHKDNLNNCDYGWKACGIVVITANYFIFDQSQLFGWLRLAEDTVTDLAILEVYMAGSV
jgi:hypothetical protein